MSTRFDWAVFYVPSNTNEHKDITGKSNQTTNIVHQPALNTGLFFWKAIR